MGGSIERGMRLAGGYEVREPIGVGGCGAVYRARQVTTGQDVAVKVLRVPEAGSAELLHRMRTRFLREMSLCAELHHPNIVRLIDSGVEGQELFSVFEYVPGATLRAYLDCNGALAAPAATALMSQVLDAIACAHRRGIVHRDIKPDNIMVMQTGALPTAKVLDFGIGSVVLGMRAPEYPSLTVTEEMLGTPAYSAPEQLRGATPTPASDLYSWALVYLECLTAERVMRGGFSDVFQEQLSPAEVALPGALLAHPLGGLLRRALRKDSHRRAGDAAQLLAELNRLQVNDLVGELNGLRARQSTAETTRTRTHEGQGSQREMRKQVTTLCYSVVASQMQRVEPDIEALEAVLVEQRGDCADLAASYGGAVCGELGDKVMVCFGHPRVSDTDARRAARAVLEQAERIANRSAVLERQHGIQLQFRAGLHTGPVVVKESGMPGGLSPAIALRLESMADPGTVLVSEATRSCLERHLYFESAGEQPFSGCATPLRLYRLVAERLTEAVRFMSSGMGEQAMFGRAAELARLKDDLAAAQRGAGRAVVIGGEPGIGKSRLLDELIRLAGLGDFQVRAMRCLSEHRNSALRPVVELLLRQLALDQAVPADELASRLGALLASSTEDPESAVPLICSWLNLPTPAGYQMMPCAPQLQRKRMLDLLRRFLLADAGGSPMVLAIEDVHWSDPTTCELLQGLVDELAEHAVLLVMTTRPTAAGPLHESSLVRYENLGPLSQIEATAMSAALLPALPVDQALMRLIVDRADGVPLFVEELTRMLFDQGLLVSAGPTHETARARLTSVPITLRDSLIERLERRGRARFTAQLAAAIGREFDFELLAASTELEKGRLRADLEELQTAKLLYRRRRIGGESFVFSHALVCEAAYESMPRSQREHAHAGIAHALAVVFPARGRAQPAELARHSAGAGDFERALSCGVEAGRRQLSLSQNQEAATGCWQMLEWVPRLADKAQQVDSELAINGLLIPALMACHGWADQRVITRVNRSQLLIERAGDTPHRLPTLCSLAFYHHVASNRQKARGLVETLLRRAHVEADGGGVVLATTLLGQCRWIEGDYPAADAMFDEVVELYDAERDQDHALTLGLDTRAWALASAGQLRYFLGESTLAFSAIERALSWAQELNSIPTLGLAYFYKALVCQYAGQRTCTEQAASAAIELAEQYGLPAIEAYTRMLHYWAQDDAASMEPLLAQLRAMGCRLGLSYYASLPADVALRKGQYDGAAAQLRSCIALCAELDEHYYEPELHRRLAECLLARGDGDGGEQAREAIRVHLRRAAEVARIQGMDRSEVAALAVESRAFGLSDRLRQRAAVIYQRRPEAFDEATRRALQLHPFLQGVSQDV